MACLSSWKLRKRKRERERERERRERERGRERESCGRLRGVVGPKMEWGPPVGN